MAAKGDFLHGKLDETESLLRLENYYRDLAYGNSVTLQYYREQNADLFDAWEQTYHDKTYTLYTDSLSLDYALLSQLVSEYDTVAGSTACRPRPGSWRASRFSRTMRPGMT